MKSKDYKLDLLKHEMITDSLPIKETAKQLKKRERQRAKKLVKAARED